MGHGPYESALLDGGALGWGHEVEVAYGFTDFWKSELALEFKQSVHEELEPTELKIENYPNWSGSWENPHTKPSAG